MRSRVSVECTELANPEDPNTDWTEAAIFIDRDGEETQMVLMTKAEFEAVYTGMWLARNDGIWSFRTVDDGVA